MRGARRAAAAGAAATTRRGAKLQVERRPGEEREGVTAAVAKAGCGILEARRGWSNGMFCCSVLASVVFVVFVERGDEQVRRGVLSFET